MFCPSCGAKNPAGVEVCVDCRRALPAHAASATPAPAPAEPPSILRRSRPLAPPPSLAAVPRVPATNTAPAPTVSAPANHAVPAAPAAPAAPARPAVAPASVPAPVSTLPAPRALSSLPRAMPPLAGRQASAAEVSEPLPPAPRATPTPLAAAPRVDDPADEATPVARPRPRTPMPAGPRPPSSTVAGAGAALAAFAAPHPSTTSPTGRRVLTVATGPRQWAAAAIDACLLVGVELAAVRALLALLDVRPTFQALTDVAHTSPARLVPVLVLAVVALLAGHLASLALAASPGQRLVGLRLVDGDGGRPSRGRLAVRATVGAVGTLLFLAGPAFALFLDQRRRGPGDIVAGTVAVRR